LKKLKISEPLNYLIGFTDFLGAKIDLSKKTFIPRPETEFWVKRAIKTINYNLNNRRNYEVKVLDMFSGSGCIGVAILLHLKNAEVSFVDRKKNCLEQIKINLNINRIKAKRYKIIKSNLFSKIKGKYDYIFANPPYVARNKISQVQESVLKFEPRQALFGGLDGLFYIKRFLKQAKNFLKPKGGVFMEFSPEQRNKIGELLKKNGYKNWEFYKDQFNRWRWVEALI